MDEPKVGDIRKYLFPSGQKRKQVYHACENCGKERWVFLVKGKPERLYCVPCRAKLNATDEWKEKIQEGSRKRWARKGERERMSKMYTGSGNPFYGKKHSYATVVKLSKPRLNIEIKHTWDWGYLCGLVLGDGTINVNNGGNYKIAVSSSKPEIVLKFKEVVERLGLNCTYYVSDVKEKWRNESFGGGDKRYTAEVLSKIVYEWLRPCKEPDFNFIIPNVIYKHKPMARGFLQGFFDAEGGAYPANYANSMNIQCWSKHKSNLDQVQDLLRIIGIESYVDNDHKKRENLSARLCISDYGNRLKFRELVGFSIKRKQAVLDNMIEPVVHHHDIEVKELVIKMLKQGIGNSEIAKLTGVSVGTVGMWKFYMKHPEKRKVVS